MDRPFLLEVFITHSMLRLLHEIIVVLRGMAHLLRGFVERRGDNFADVLVGASAYKSPGAKVVVTTAVDVHLTGFGPSNSGRGLTETRKAT